MGPLVLRLSKYERRAEVASSHSPNYPVYPNLKRMHQMPKFIVLYRSPCPAADMLKNVTPEEMQEGMKLWQTWVEKCGDALVEMGSPLAQWTSIGRSDNSRTTPKGGVTGYSIIQADTLDEGLNLLEGHPHLGWHEDCHIDVQELLDM